MSTICIDEEELSQLREENERLRKECDRLHQLVCEARDYIDPGQHAEWETQAAEEAIGCSNIMAMLQEQRDSWKAQCEAAQAENLRFRKAIAPSWPLDHPIEQYEGVVKRYRDSATKVATAKDAHQCFRQIIVDDIGVVRCQKCSRDFGWYCPTRSENAGGITWCEYLASHVGCVHCGKSEERK